MTISEYITILKDAKKEYGDLEVYMYDHEEGVWNEPSVPILDTDIEISAEDFLDLGY